MGSIKYFKKGRYFLGKVASPRLEKLDKEFSDSGGGEWKEARIGDLFIKKTIKGVPKRDQNLNPDEQGYHMFGQNMKY